MTKPIDITAARATIRDLNEVITALDRRVPHVERRGEVSIARAAAALRAEAVKRIAELERDVSAASVLAEQADAPR
jgi:hypothetical protein